MMVNLEVGPIVSLIAGVLILIVPRLLNYIVAIYLIVIGLIGIFGWGSTHLRTTSGTDSNARAVVSVPVDASDGRLVYRALTQRATAS